MPVLAATEVVNIMQVFFVGEKVYPSNYIDWVHEV